MAADVITVGGSYLLTLNSLTNAATSAYINDATVTYVVYKTADDSAVSGASGSMAYLAASNGIYQATIAPATTATLIAGASYYALMTPTEGSLSDPIRLDLTAQAPGLTILDAQGWQDAVGVSYTGADLVSLQTNCEKVCELLARMCYPNLLSPRTLTLFPFDAPAMHRELQLPRPIRLISAIHYASGANGDSSQTSSSTLLTPFVDYLSKPDDVITGWNRSGIVLRLNQSSWGGINVRPPGRLGYRLADEPGAVFVSAALGPDRINPAVRGAAVTAVTLMMQRRKRGAPMQSESYASYSYSLASQFTAEAAIRSPDVLQDLMSVGVLPFHVG